MRTLQGTIQDIDHPEQFQKLMADWCSAKRFAFCRFQDGLGVNEVRETTAKMYPDLNSRWMVDAADEAKAMFTYFRQKKVIFGSRKLFRKVTKGTATSEQWKQSRDNMLFSRGSKAKLGNLNIRLLQDKEGNFKIRINKGTRDYIFADLWLPKKHRQAVSSMLTSDKPCYVVRIIREPKQIRVMITFVEPLPQLKHFLANGCLGVDLNPSQIAVAHVAPDGNLQSSRTIQNNRIIHARKGKRSCDVWQIANEIVSEAKSLGVGIAVENLKFKQNEKKGPKAEAKNHKRNRVLKNFVWKQLLTAIAAKALREGVELWKVNPAFTSVIGRLKFCVSQTVHESAAWAIARRGLGLDERIPDWLRSVVAGTLQEKGIKQSNWEVWSMLKKLTVPDRKAPKSSGNFVAAAGGGMKAFVPQRVRRSPNFIVAAPSGLTADPHGSATLRLLGCTEREAIASDWTW